MSYATAGGRGGGAISIVANVSSYSVVDVNGSIRMNGQSASGGGCDTPGGGGSGGGCICVA
jgi:hypothetical protein